MYVVAPRADTFVSFSLVFRFSKVLPFLCSLQSSHMYTYYTKWWKHDRKRRRRRKKCVSLGKAPPPLALEGEMFSNEEELEGKTAERGNWTRKKKGRPVVAQLTDSRVATVADPIAFARRPKLNQWIVSAIGIIICIFPSFLLRQIERTFFASDLIWKIPARKGKIQLWRSVWFDFILGHCQIWSCCLPFFFLVPCVSSIWTC